VVRPSGARERSAKPDLARRATSLGTVQPWSRPALQQGSLVAVIRLAEIRAAVTRALISLRTKRETLPPKKHGNIPP
jgi:acetyl-CoA carboxylase carboxyltransferase component